MRLFQFILLIIIFQSCSTPQIFNYEQEISASIACEFLEIDFTNLDDKLKLSGTLIYPKGSYDKVVMIVPGSGKDTRHSHFILTENYLLNNIAVFRFDERGIGKSEGNYDYTATTLMHDVIYAYRKLKNLEVIADKKIGILGHSLGGIASIGAYGKGCDFDFLIQMATSVEKDGAFIKYQATTNMDGFYTVKNKTTAEVISFIDTLSKMVALNEDDKTIEKKGKEIMEGMDFSKGKHIFNPLIIDLMQQNHEETYKNCTVPILFIVGTADRIISSNHEPKALERINNDKIDIKIMDQLNHWLNDKIGPTKMKKSLYHMDATAMSEIINWTLEK